MENLDNLFSEIEKQKAIEVKAQMLAYYDILKNRYKKILAVLKELDEQGKEHRYYERWNDIHDIENTINESMKNLIRDIIQQNWIINEFVAF